MSMRSGDYQTPVRARDPAISMTIHDANLARPRSLQQPIPMRYSHCDSMCIGCARASDMRFQSAWYTSTDSAQALLRGYHKWLNLLPEVIRTRVWSSVSRIRKSALAGPVKVLLAIHTSQLTNDISGICRQLSILFFIQ